ncbi:MAG: UDP-N-acetylmuramoyl-tripeptide--D-alanyl-D-alanine ligase, partial [Candidatus Omnitrophota bacterium]|nr:UDP-N-acetylmuramoyl-tripeptide--D-alanyl-D-alanine ligase [Candidatus Omnitrophota bacterium]
MFTVKDILVATKARLFSGSEDDILKGVCTDTRRLKKGELFLAIKGERFDGHNFILDAVSKGARGVLAQDGCIVNSKFRLPDMVFISVPNSIRALGDIANYHRNRFNIPFIGITGSNGKTTTKEMASAILSKKFDCLKSFGTENNQIGVPFTLLRLNANHKIAVLEMGTNHIGEIGRLSEITRPTIAVITNVGPSHLEHLKDTDTVLKAKSEILEHLHKDGKLVVNADDESVCKMKTDFKMIRFGLKKTCDFYADNLNVEPDKINFRLNGKWEINLNLVGRHNVYNALAAIAASWDFGISIDDIRDALEEFK